METCRDATNLLNIWFARYINFSKLHERRQSCLCRFGFDILPTPAHVFEDCLVRPTECLLAHRFVVDGETIGFVRYVIHRECIHLVAEFTDLLFHVRRTVERDIVLIGLWMHVGRGLSESEALVLLTVTVDIINVEEQRLVSRGDMLSIDVLVRIPDASNVW